MLGWWKYKDDFNVLMLKYEDLKKVSGLLGFVIYLCFWFLVVVRFLVGY